MLITNINLIYLNGIKEQRILLVNLQQIKQHNIMNKEILKRNIEEAIMQPCNANYPKRIKENGLSEDGTYIMVKIRPDDSSWQCNLVDRDGNPVDYVENILEHLPEKYRDHLVTIKHDNWVSYSYVPVFDTDTQAIWDKAVSDYIKAKQEWCDKYGCD